MTANALDKLVEDMNCAVHHVQDDKILFEIIGPSQIIIVYKNGTFEIIER